MGVQVNLLLVNVFGHLLKRITFFKKLMTILFRITENELFVKVCYFDYGPGPVDTTTIAGLMHLSPILYPT